MRNYLQWALSAFLIVCSLVGLVILADVVEVEIHKVDAVVITK